MFETAEIHFLTTPLSSARGRMLIFYCVLAGQSRSVHPQCQSATLTDPRVFIFICGRDHTVTIMKNEVVR